MLATERTRTCCSYSPFVDVFQDIRILIDFEKV